MRLGLHIGYWGIGLPLGALLARPHAWRSQLGTRWAPMTVDVAMRSATTANRLPSTSTSGTRSRLLYVEAMVAPRVNLRSVDAQPACSLHPPTKVRRCGILALLNDAATDCAGPREQVEQGFPVAEPDGSLEQRQVFAKALQSVEHRLAIGEEDVPPHDRT